MKFLTVCKIAVLALFFVLAEGAFAETYLVVYEDQPLHYRGFDAMQDCAPGIMDSDNPVRDTKIGLHSLEWLNAVLHATFTYAEDGLTDTWCDNMAEVFEGLPWEGDCDNFALTFLAIANYAGFDKRNMWALTVVTWEEWWYYRRNDFPVGHPAMTQANHMIAAVEIEGETGLETWIFDNRSREPRLAADAFLGWGRYVLQGICKMEDYGNGMDNTELCHRVWAVESGA